MSTKTTIQLIDDVDGTEAVESITFGIDGVVYEIDLNEENSGKLRDGVFGSYIDAGRRTGGRLHSGATKSVAKPAVARAGISREERKAIQRWAAQNGFTVPSDRGRIATQVVEAWTADGRPMQ